jgi:RHS repeat-associated protein
VTRRGNGKPQALVHLFAGASRLASVWLSDKDGDDLQVFTYHTQLQTRNVSDVIRSTAGKPKTARLHQQVEYAAFGEILDERERSLDENLVTLPNGEKRALTSREAAGLMHYRFNGKEEDEAGIIDFGARSYDPRLSMWLRPDPALGAYLGGNLNGGIYAPKNLASYQFAGQNPISNTEMGGAYTCVNTDCATSFDPKHESLAAGALTYPTGTANDAITYHLFRPPTPLPPGHSVTSNLETIYPSGNIAMAPINWMAAVITAKTLLPNGEIWDYKRRYGQEWDDAGNFNYGYILAGLHVPEEFAIRFAGFYKEFGSHLNEKQSRYDPSYGHFYDMRKSSTRGISASNLEEIDKAYEYYRDRELIDWLYSKAPQPLDSSDIVRPSN